MASTRINRIIALVLTSAVIIGIVWLRQPVDDPEKAHTETAEHGHEEGGERTHIAAAMAHESGIVTERAGAGTIEETVTLTGEITLNADRTAQVKARFPGIVRAMDAGLGDTVKKGQRLAVVEGNDSLLPYSVTAPIAGTVLTRTSNVGDVAGDGPLFTLADLSTVWAEFHLFPGQRAAVAIGQTVAVTAEGDVSAEGRIHSLLPVADAATQTLVVRVILDNPGGRWQPGMAVQGMVTTAKHAVPLAVKRSALQRMDGRTVVFVKTGDDYTAMPLTLGRRDASSVEVVGGLDAEAEVVTKNSFLIKADIEKAGAEHEH